LAWGAERGDDEDDAGVPVAGAGALAWIQLQRDGHASDDVSCNQRSRQGKLSGFRVLLLILAVSF